SHTETVPCTSARHPAKYAGTAMTSVYTVDVAKDLGKLSPITLAADGATVYSTASSLYITSQVSPKATQINRFDITRAGQPAYLGARAVAGTLLNSYSMSEFDGHLRVVTTLMTDKGKTQSVLFELDDATLKVVGRLAGLGPNERVYAVRFLGALGYVVTYRSIDPLYVLDLHNPAA